MKISEIPDKLWKPKKDVLEYAIKGIIGDTGCIKRNHTSERLANIINFDGYYLPMQFDCDKRKLFVWSRATKFSGCLVGVDDLWRLQSIIDYWYEEEILGYLAGFTEGDIS